jgi:hypothetical protein
LISVVVVPAVFSCLGLMAFLALVGQWLLLGISATNQFKALANFSS